MTIGARCVNRGTALAFCHWSGQGQTRAESRYSLAPQSNGGNRPKASVQPALPVTFLRMGTICPRQLEVQCPRDRGPQPGSRRLSPAPRYGADDVRMT
jgi:hypothetical protein